MSAVQAAETEPGITDICPYTIQIHMLKVATTHHVSDLVTMKKSECILKHPKHPETLVYIYTS